MKVVNLANEHERLQWREKLGEVLSEKTLYVSEVTFLKQFILKNTLHLYLWSPPIIAVIAGDEQV